MIQHQVESQPIRIPYGRQCIDDEDIAAAVAILRADWLTTGPLVGEFERCFAEYVGAREAVAVNSGTAALHAAMYALGIGPDQEVIVPALTFAASANCVAYLGGKPIFADVDPETLLIDVASVERCLSSRTRAIMAVDYAGQPCDYDALRCIAESAGIALVDDASHSLGGAYRGRPVGVLADLNTFSFHPVKLITTGEGGMVTTHHSGWAARMRRFRNHNMNVDFRQREERQQWLYHIEELGYNYRLTDFQCALGLSQLKKARGWVERRQYLAQLYDEILAGTGIQPLKTVPQTVHARHLYVVLLPPSPPAVPREEVFQRMRQAGIGVNVHYLPVHLHPFYRQKFGTKRGLCPAAEAAYERILSLPLFPGMTEEMVREVAQTLLHAIES